MEKQKQTQPDALDRALTDLYAADIPEGFRAGWRAALQREEQTPMKNPYTAKDPRHPFLRVALPVAAALVLTIGAITAGNLIPATVNSAPYAAVVPMATSYPVAGGGANETYALKASSADMAVSAMAPQEEAAFGAGTGAARSTADSGAQTDAATARKVVRTVDLTIATITFDQDVSALTTLVSAMGGSVANVSQYGDASDRMDRYAYYTLRIPSAQLDAFLGGLRGIGRITYRNESSTDMTTQYADNAMRLKTQQDKMTRLQELMLRAADVSDLLEIENQIADTQYQIDSLQSAQLTIDRDVDQSTVTLTLQEQSPEQTAQTVELTLWQRLSSGFEASIRGMGQFGQNLLVFLAMFLPVLLPLALLAGLIGWAVRASRRRRQAEAQPISSAVMNPQAAPAAQAGSDEKPTTEPTPASAKNAPPEP